MDYYKLNNYSPSYNHVHPTRQYLGYDARCDYAAGARILMRFVEYDELYPPWGQSCLDVIAWQKEFDFVNNSFETVSDSFTGDISVGGSKLFSFFSLISLAF